MFKKQQSLHKKCLYFKIFTSIAKEAKYISHTKEKFYLLDFYIFKDMFSLYFALKYKDYYSIL